VACAVFERVGDRASVQVVGGLSAEQAVALARKGLRAFVFSGDLGCQTPGRAMACRATKSKNRTTHPGFH
jgi:hypothetical protein